MGLLTSGWVTPSVAGLAAAGAALARVAARATTANSVLRLCRREGQSRAATMRAILRSEGREGWLRQRVVSTGASWQCGEWGTRQASGN
jgi:hypothetical protein